MIMVPTVVTLVRQSISIVTAAFLVFGWSPVAFADEMQPPISSVVVLVDTSGSMSGDRIESAQLAIESFMTQLPANVDVGLVTFSTSSKVVVPLTSDRALVTAALKEIRASGNTSMYDGIALALSTLTDPASSRVVVLSDGDDTVSRLSLTRLLAIVDDSLATIDVIALRATVNHASKLRSIVKASGGQLIDVKDTNQLIEAYSALAQEISTPVKPAVTPSPKQVPEIVMPSTRTWAEQVKERARFIGIAVGALTFALLFNVLRLWLAARKATRLQRILNQYGPKLGRYESGIRKAWLKFLSNPRVRVVLMYFAERLERAGIKVPVNRALLVVAALAILMAFALVPAIGILSLLVGPLVALMLVHIILKQQFERRRKQFEEQLPDFLQLVSSALRSGLSFAQSIELSSEDSTGPLGDEMRQAVSEASIGASLEDALRRSAERMKSKDLDWVLTALSIQREVGGNLSAILDSAAQVISMRDELRGEIKTLSAEGRLSAYVLIALPIGTFGFLGVVRTDYVSIFWREPVGIAMALVMISLFAAGWFWMKKIVNLGSV